MIKKRIFIIATILMGSHAIADQSLATTEDPADWPPAVQKAEKKLRTEDTSVSINRCNSSNPATYRVDLNVKVIEKSSKEDQPKKYIKTFQSIGVDTNGNKVSPCDKVKRKIGKIPEAVKQAALEIKANYVRTVVNEGEERVGNGCQPKGKYYRIDLELLKDSDEQESFTCSINCTWETAKFITMDKNGKVMEFCSE
ncbi:MAG: hypothetical protein K1X29_09425 [Bdellovibrionales bacterium]|nr:hypothetical protein [Bdellovibrionales bacterium]